MPATFRLHSLHSLALRASFMSPLSGYRPCPIIFECAEGQDGRTVTILYKYSRSYDGNCDDNSLFSMIKFPDRLNLKACLCVRV
jgi:hypothetical protein